MESGFNHILPRSVQFLLYIYNIFYAKLRKEQHLSFNMNDLLNESVASDYYQKQTDAFLRYKA